MMFFTDGEHLLSKRVTNFSTPFLVWKILESSMGESSPSFKKSSMLDSRLLNSLRMRRNSALMFAYSLQLLFIMVSVIGSIRRSKLFLPYSLPRPNYSQWTKQGPTYLSQTTWLRLSKSSPYHLRMLMKLPERSESEEEGLPLRQAAIIAKRQYEPIPPLKLELNPLMASMYLKRMISFCTAGILAIQSFISKVDSQPTLVTPLMLIVMSTFTVLPAGHLSVSRQQRAIGLQTLKRSCLLLVWRKGIDGSISNFMMGTLALRQVEQETTQPIALISTAIWARKSLASSLTLQGSQQRRISTSELGRERPIALDPKRRALAIGYKLCTNTLTLSKAMTLNSQSELVSMLICSTTWSNCLVISLLHTALRASRKCSFSFLHFLLLRLLRLSRCSFAQFEKLFSEDSQPTRELQRSSSLYFSLISPSQRQLKERMCYGDLVRLGETQMRFLEALGFRFVGDLGLEMCMGCFLHSLDYSLVGELIFGDYLPIKAEE